MSGATSSKPLIAVDIGNSRVKLGLFEGGTDALGLPQPSATQIIEPALNEPDFRAWLGRCPASCQWLIASVQRTTAANLLARLDREGITSYRLLRAVDLPLKTLVPEPEKVGMDRLADAVAANFLRQPGQGAVIVDVGSAITVDSVNAGGAFVGGAILGGIGLSARALHEFTDLLPKLDMHELHEPPPVLGSDTMAAMRSGLFWGALGSIRELSMRQMREVPANHLFLTGGAGPAVADFLREGASYPVEIVPHLTLAGIALSAC
jgi:type III pantothenate kinase